MQFTSALFALTAALAMVNPSEASFIGKVLGGKKRDTGLFSRMEADGLWSRATAQVDPQFKQDFQSCMTKSHEILRVSHVGVATSGTYKLSAQDGSFPPDCIHIADNYIQTGKGVAGTLKKDGASYDLTVTKPADKTTFDALVAKTN